MRLDTHRWLKLHISVSNVMYLAFTECRDHGNQTRHVRESSTVGVT
jgi:hypothetical protein